MASYSSSASRYSTSGANRAAPSGAWKMAPIPPRPRPIAGCAGSWASDAKPRLKMTRIRSRSGRWAPLCPGAAAADGDRRSHDLYQGHPFAHVTAAIMESFNHGVGAVPFRLRSNQKYQEVAAKPPRWGGAESEVWCVMLAINSGSDPFTVSDSRLAGSGRRGVGVFNNTSEEDGPRAWKDSHHHAEQRPARWLDQPYCSPSALASGEPKNVLMLATHFG